MRLAGGIADARSLNQGQGQGGQSQQGQGGPTGNGQNRLPDLSQLLTQGGAGASR